MTNIRIKIKYLAITCAIIPLVSACSKSAKDRSHQIDHFQGKQVEILVTQKTSNSEFNIQYLTSPDYAKRDNHVIAGVMIGGNLENVFVQSNDWQMMIPKENIIAILHRVPRENVMPNEE